MAANKERIAFICHPYHRGGVTSWMRDAAIAYAKGGREVYFVTVDPVKPFVSGKDREKMTEMVRKGGARVGLVSAPVNFTFEFGTDEYRASVYQVLIEKHVPAGTPLIISDDLSVWKAAAAIADAYPMVGVLHGDQDHYYNKAKAFQQQLSVCACVSDRIRKKAAERCTQLDAARLFTIPCGIDLPVFAPANENPEVCKLIFIGRITDYEKRAEDLVNICAAMHAQGRNIHLDIVGSTAAGAADFVKQAKDQGVAQFITYHGWRSKGEIHELLGHSDILLLTSNSEGMPLVMMEALGAGCGFVGTRVSGIEDYEYDVRSANCLGVYTVGDIYDAIVMIDKIAAIPTDIRSHAARALAEAEFSMDVCLDKYDAAITASPSVILKSQPIVLSFVQKIQSMLIATARYLKVRIAS